MSVQIPKGFLFAAATARIKESGNPDLAYVEAPRGATAAAMFTTNRVVAAPVTVGREHLRASRGRIRALLINAGNANCATGSDGLAAARESCEALAALLSVSPQEIIPGSTGIIGVPFPTSKLLAALPALLANRRADADGAYSVARAIMTTDTRMKTASTSVSIDGRDVRVLGIAKGAGMIHPNMATLLVYLFTDIDASAPELRRVLRPAVAASFNSISIDGDTSTNDTVILMASGTSGACVRTTADEAAFLRAVTEICASLAAQVVADGEGVKHTVTLRVDGAATHAAADRIARTLAHSLLVKTAWAGADPNWGRLLAAVGRAGVSVDPDVVAIWIGGEKVCERGAAFPFDATAVHKMMSEPSYEIRVQVGGGEGAARILTGDLTAEYVRINADYST
ncbi:MAG TPA: bifunctional glutamate N-acetyltransferase/amino-acid acetyltransferase ArgJ [Candidatus Krumholzibacteria bacterium]|nr:bifunctional glutamate N-acetyltransferase/amino-acid acetyltransferase ArgJ [Candidatus Krumholzibacteria bacterium]